MKTVSLVVRDVQVKEVVMVDQVAMEIARYHRAMVVPAEKEEMPLAQLSLKPDSLYLQAQEETEVLAEVQPVQMPKPETMEETEEKVVLEELADHRDMPV